MDMPKYRSHKVVGALEIAHADKMTGRVSFNDHGDTIIVDKDLFSRHQPVGGDFLVEYGDGYQSFSPRQAFIDGYMPIDAWAPTPAPVQTERQPSNLELHAEKELRIAGLFDKDADYGGDLGESVMKLIRTFSGEGHSGGSAHMAINIFEKVSRFEPLTPLTGAEDEWHDVSDMGDGSPNWQNVRCSHVFKNEAGAYDINGKVFREPNGSCFTNGDSRVPVTFPYTPTIEYVDVPAQPVEF